MRHTGCKGCVLRVTRMTASTHLAESALCLLVERTETQGADMARPVVALGKRPVLNGLSTDPAHCAVFDRCVCRSRGVNCDRFVSCCLAGFNLSTSNWKAVRLGAVGRIAGRAAVPRSAAPTPPVASASPTAAIGRRTGVCSCGCGGHVQDIRMMRMREGGFGGGGWWVSR